MMSSSMTPIGFNGSRNGIYFPNQSDIYSAYSKEYSMADLSARFGPLTHEWSMLSAKDTPRASATPGLSFLSNQQIYKRVLEWFEIWRPWQQRMFLCGLTNRCSTNQLETLATALEPVFHRDFAITLKRRYPSASFKTQPRMPLLPIREKTKVKKKKIKPVKKVPNISDRNKSRTIIKQNSRSNLGDIPYTSSLTTPHTDINSSSSSLPRIPDIPNENTAKAIDREEKEVLLPAITKSMEVVRHDNDVADEMMRQDNESQPNKSESQPALSVEDFATNMVDIVMKSSMEKIDIEMSLGHLSSVTDAIDNLIIPRALNTDKEKTSQPTTSSTRPVQSRGLPTKSSSKRVRIRGAKEEDLVSRSLPVQGRDMLKFSLVESGDLLTSNPTQHHNAWASHDIPADTKPEENLIVKQNFKTHRHRSAFEATDDVHSKDFFKMNRFKVFASYKQDSRFGPMRRPDMIDDVNVPVQKLYKSTLWLPETPREGTVYVKPNSAHLKSHFKEQIEQIWEWMEGWQDFEKLHLLKRLLKLSNSDLMNYLAQCLYTRLHDRCGLNWLPDKLLLLIFSYMNFDDIESCSRVCRRWKFLTSVEELWMLKCHEHGLANKLPNITQQIAQRSAREKQEVDWKLAYFEVQEITNEVKASLPVPTSLTFEDECLMSDFASVSELPDDASTASDLPRGLGARLAHESEKLKKSFRDKQKYLAEKAKQEAEERRREARRAQYSTQHSSLSTDDASTEAGTNAGSRLSNVQSRLRKISGGSDVDEDGLEAVQEERPVTPPPKDLNEWVQRMSKSGEENDVSLDVRSELKQATDVIPKKSSSKELLRRSQTSLLDGKKPATKEKTAEASLVQSVRRVRRFYGHMDSVLTMAMDRRRLITASLDRSIRVFDIRDGTTIRKLCGHKGAVTCLAFDNEVLYSGSWDMTVMVWDLVYFERITVLHGHMGSVTCMAQDDTYVLSGSHDGTVRVWYKMSLLPAKVLKPHKLHIQTMAYDGTFIYTGSSDRTVVVTNIKTEEQVLTFTGHPMPFQFITLQGALMISANSKGQVWFWNKDTGRAEAAIQAHEEAITAVRYVKGRFFTASKDMMIKEWDLNTMTCLRTLVGHKGQINDILVTDDKMVSVDATAQVRVWDFSLPLIKLGGQAGSGSGPDSAEEDMQIDHNIIEEAELLKPKPPPTPPDTKASRRKKKKKKKKDGEDKK